MKNRVAILMFLGVLLTGCSLAQVQTDCSTSGTSSNGNINATTNCTSTDTGAAVAERNRQNAEAGQAMGNALGTGLAAVIQNHRAQHFVKKFCKQNGPGATWWYQFQGQPQITGTCGDSDVARRKEIGRSDAAANSWHTQKYCETDGFIWIDGACHAEGFKSKSVSTTPQGVECPCDRYTSRDPESCRKAWQCK